MQPEYIPMQHEVVQVFVFCFHVYKLWPIDSYHLHRVEYVNL